MRRVHARLSLAAALTVLVVLCAVAGGARAVAAPSPPLAKKLARALAVPQINPVLSGAVALDLSSGQVVFARNATRSLIPASNEKLAVAYAALAALGPQFRTHTDVLGQGRRAGTTWRGNLVLKGYGDPTLSTSDLRRLAARVRAAGIVRVSGRIVGDESFFDPRRTAPGWKPWFYLNECPPLSALVVDRAVYRGRLTRAPALAAAAGFRAALRRAGVAVAHRSLTAPVGGNLARLASSYSPPLWRLVRFMNRTSDNFTAEMLLKQLGALYGGRGATSAGAAVVTRLLAADGVPLAGVRIVDGSGLSPLDRLTPRALVALLQAAWANPPVGRALLAGLPVAGKVGTLRRRMLRPPAFGKVFAKTGTTMYSSSLAGFVRSRYAFAVIQNGNPIASWWARVAQDRFATVLAAA